jgi:hypothetical protein
MSAPSEGNRLFGEFQFLIILYYLIEEENE